MRKVFIAIIIALSSLSCAANKLDVKTSFIGPHEVRGDKVDLYLSYCPSMQVTFMFKVSIMDDMAMSRAAGEALRLMYGTIGRNYIMKFKYKIRVARKTSEGLMNVEHWVFDLVKVE